MSILAGFMLAIAVPVRGGFSIETPDGAAPWELNAAMELSNYLHQAVPSEIVSVGGHFVPIFHVGNTRFAASKGLSGDRLKDEEWVIRSFGRDIVLNGGGTRGCLYAVSHFLEDHVGIRWWEDGDEDVPHHARLALSALDRRGKPHFMYRNVYRDIDARDFHTAVRNRLNANGADGGYIPVEWGGSIEYGSPKHAHTWDIYLPYKEFGKDHPEWYALWKGSRVNPDWDGTQLCLTNPEMFAKFRERLLANIAARKREAEKMGTVFPPLYDVSMNDNHVYCTCPACVRETELYGHSGRQLRFVNRLAAAVAEKHSEVYLTMLAYYGAEPVPKGGVRAAKNVIIKFCLTQQNEAADFGDATNDRQRKLLESWKVATDNIFVWDYTTTYRKPFIRGLPYPSEFHIGSKIRTCGECNVTGIFNEHEQHATGDMWALKFYVERKFYEDPTLDNEALVRTFCREYYGERAGALVFEARDRMRRAAAEKRAVVTWEPQLGSFNYIDNDLLKRLNALYDAAETAAADDAKHLRRVRTGRKTLAKLTALRAHVGALRPPEPGVSDRPFYSMPVDDRTTLIWDNSDKARRQVEDSEAFNGRAVCWPKRLLPFACGIYDSYGEKHSSLPAIKASKGSGYNWYSLGKATVPIGYLWWADWGMQIDFAIPEAQGKACEIRLHVKFTETETRVDRLILVPTDNP